MFAILHISDSDKHWSEAINEYTKRLGKLVSIDTVKPVKHGTQNQIIEKETQNILEKLEKKYQNRNIVLLSKSGEVFSTEDLWRFLKKWKESRTVFVIWGPYWFNEDKLVEYWAKKISFGKITLPHWLAKLILLEQMYRIWTIESWKKYHY